ncbi:MAG: hypothetical protein ABIC95_03525 [archaeon]
MMQGRDWISFLIGAMLTLFGLLPLLARLKIGPKWFSLEQIGVEIFAYVVAIMGIYLVMNSIIEITNSNSIGWMSFLVAALLFVVGMLQVLAKFGVGPDWFELAFITPIIYHVIFVVEGLFLVIAAFAMEL